MTFPDATLTTTDGGLGAGAPDNGNVVAVIGCSTLGADFKPTKFQSISTLIATQGYGAAVDLAAALIDAGATVIFCKTTSTTAGAASAVTPTGTSTSVMTVTGTPNDTLDVIVEVVSGGTLGSSPAPTIKYTLDGGNKYIGPVRLTGAAPVAYAIPNTDITLHFAAGTLVAGDTFAFTTTEPLWDDSDLADAFAALGLTTYDWEFACVVGACAKSDAAAVDTALTTLETQKRYVSALVNTEDFGANTEAQWMTAIQADYAAFQTTHTGVCAGPCQFDSAISPFSFRRPIMWAAALHAVLNTIHDDLGRVKSGPLGGPKKRVKAIYHDERQVPGLDSSGFITSCTRLRKTGFYIVNPNLMCPPGSDYTLWQYRRVINAVCRSTYDTLVDEVSDNTRLDPAGNILEKDAIALEQTNQDGLTRDVVSKGHVTATKTTVDRAYSQQLKTVNVKVRAQPLGYKKAIAVDIGFAATL